MSKINATVLQEAVQAIIDGSHKKSGKAIRKFPESVDLQVLCNGNSRTIDVIRVNAVQLSPRHFLLIR